MKSADEHFDPATGNTTVIGDDGTTSVFAQDGRLLSTTTVIHTPGQPDKTVTETYTAWDDKTHQPTAGTGPDGAFTLVPHNGNVVKAMVDGSSTSEFSPSGQLLSQTTQNHTPGQPDTTTTSTFSPDGRVLSTTTVVHHPGQPDTTVTEAYTAWDDKTHQPTAGTGPDGAFTLVPHNGNVVKAMVDGSSTSEFSPSGQLLSQTTQNHTPGQPDTTTTSTFSPDGRLLSSTTTTHTPGQPDTTVTETYTAWDDKTHQPTAGTGPGGAFTLSDQNGNTVKAMADGSSISVFSPAGQLVSQTTVTHPPGQPDTTTTSLSSFSPDGRVLSTTTTTHTPGQPDTTVTETFTAWDDKTHQPTAGTGPDGPFTLSYDKGSTTRTMPDGSSATFSSDGRLMETTSAVHHPGQPDTFETTKYSAWGPDGPTAGRDENGAFTIDYDHQTGNKTITYTDGPDKDTKMVVDKNGKMVSTTLPDGTFIDWDIELTGLHALVVGMAKHQQVVTEAVAGIKGQFNTIRGAWRAPATESFDTITAGFTKAAETMVEVMAEAAKRMQQTYTTIVDTESANANTSRSA